MTTPQTEVAALSKRPKRADALRNYEKLVAAAREAFTEADRSASLEDIAAAPASASARCTGTSRRAPTWSQAIYVDEVEALSRSAPSSPSSSPGRR
jgi:pyocin large subunit-like protein